MVSTEMIEPSLLLDPAGSAAVEATKARDERTDEDRIVKMLVKGTRKLRETGFV